MYLQEVEMNYKLSVLGVLMICSITASEKRISVRELVALQASQRQSDLDGDYVVVNRGRNSMQEHEDGTFSLQRGGLPSTGWCSDNFSTVQLLKKLFGFKSNSHQNSNGQV